MAKLVREFKKMRCLKQQTLAIIVNNGKFWVGRNDCIEERSKCPRVEEKCKTGEGYDLCVRICGQEGHAEVMACKAAGKEAKGGTLYLFGHTYICGDCLKVIGDHGIQNIRIMGVHNG